MSARLKLKKLKLQTKYVIDNCRRREAEALHEKLRVEKLLRENTIVVEAIAEIAPADTYRGATECLDYTTRTITNALVRKYTERLCEYVRNHLTSKYMFNRFSTFGVRLLAPALTEDHIEVRIKEIT